MQLTKVQFVENRGLVFWMHDCMVYMCLFCPEHGKKLRGFTHGAGWWVWARYRWHLHKLWSSSWGLSSWYIPRLAIGWQNFLSWYWFARLQSLQCWFYWPSLYISNHSALRRGMFKTTQPYLWGILLIRNYTVDLLIPSLINSKIPWCFLTQYIIYYKTVIFENVVYNHNLSDKFLKWIWCVCI